MCRVAVTELPYIDQMLFNSEYYLRDDLKRENDLKDHQRKIEEAKLLQE